MYNVFSWGKLILIFIIILICRLAKEKVMYEKEAKQQEERIEKMKAEAGDDYAIKKQVNSLHCSQIHVIDLYNVNGLAWNCKTTEIFHMHIMDCFT